MTEADILTFESKVADQTEKYWRDRGSEGIGVGTGTQTFQDVESLLVKVSNRDELTMDPTSVSRQSSGSRQSLVVEYEHAVKYRTAAPIPDSSDASVLVTEPFESEASREDFVDSLNSSGGGLADVSDATEVQILVSTLSPTAACPVCNDECPPPDSGPPMPSTRMAAASATALFVISVLEMF